MAFAADGSMQRLMGGGGGPPPGRPLAAEEELMAMHKEQLLMRELARAGAGGGMNGVFTRVPGPSSESLLAETIRQLAAARSNPTVGAESMKPGVVGSGRFGAAGMKLPTNKYYQSAAAAESAASAPIGLNGLSYSEAYAENLQKIQAENRRMQLEALDRIHAERESLAARYPSDGPGRYSAAEAAALARYHAADGLSRLQSDGLGRLPPETLGRYSGDSFSSRLSAEARLSELSRLQAAEALSNRLQSDGLGRIPAESLSRLSGQSLGRLSAEGMGRLPPGLNGSAGSGPGYLTAQQMEDAAAYGSSLGMAERRAAAGLVDPHKAAAAAKAAAGYGGALGGGGGGVLGGHPQGRGYGGGGGGYPSLEAAKAALGVEMAMGGQGRRGMPGVGPPPFPGTGGGPNAGLGSRAGLQGMNTAAAGLTESVKRDPNALPGMIFGCNQRTKDECFRRGLFGLPMSNASTVEKIGLGTKLFLFNFGTKELYGIFEATCNGAINIEPDAFATAGFFPAQVRARLVEACVALHETEFKPAIQENYFSDKKFNYILNEKQVDKLMELFHSARDKTGAGGKPLASIRQGKRSAADSIASEPKKTIQARLGRRVKEENGVKGGVDGMETAVEKKMEAGKGESKEQQAEECNADK